MAINQISRLLEFANIQIAAEAFLVEGADGGIIQPDDVIRDRLVRGNFHSSKFILVQAEKFVADYQVLAQYRNDPTLPGQSGFSGTLFKNKTTGELTLSFRSTEFIDDAVRDSKSTNELEIKELGWAFGQIAEMEAWYAQLRQDPALLGGRNFNVTGYSLGGHLATAFNILRREEAEATGNANPVIATYTFNGAGTGAILDGRRLSDIIADFNRIRADFAASPEWTSLSVGDQNTVSALAQSRVDAINAERFRVAGLSGVTRAFAASAPTGSQTLLGYQIAALLVGQNTVGASNFPLPGGTNNIPSSPVFAADALRFANMTEVVGMETAGLATSFVSNSGIHYGFRQEVAIEAQPKIRGSFSLLDLLQRNLLVDNPSQNDFGDTHSLVLVVDSLSLIAAMETLAPNLTLETAQQILAAMSSAAASDSLFTQGKAEGDTLERMLDALRNLVLGPGQTPTLTEEDYKKSLEGNTWHLNDFRAPFHQNLALLNEAIQNQGLTGTLTIDNLVGISATDLSNIAQGSTAYGYRYALKELNPFAILGNNDLYAPHNANGELELYNVTNRTGTLTTEWIADRAAFLAWKNIANNINTINFQNTQSAESWRFVDLPQNYTVNVAGVLAGTTPNAVTHRAVFGGEQAEGLIGGSRTDRLYGSGGSDYLEGKADDDYLEGGSGLDVYNYNASRGLLGPANDGADTIRDTDGRGVLRYAFKDLFANPQSTVIAEASVKRSGTEWQSADGKFTYTKTTNAQGGTDLLITINGDAGGSLNLKDYRDGDFGIRLWEARTGPQTARDIIGDLEPVDPPATDDLGNVIVTGNLALNRADTLNDSTGNDRIISGGGDDIVNAFRGGDDWINAGDGRDRISAGAGNDLIEAGADGDGGGDIVDAGTGDDEIYAEQRLNADLSLNLRDAIRQGNEAAPTNLKGDFLAGGAGDDWIIGARADNVLTGGGGQDLIIGGAGNDTIWGNSGLVATTLGWTITRNVINQNGQTIYSADLTGVVLADNSADGADTIYAGLGADWIFAGAGDDFIDEGSGDEVAFGEAGSDVLIGGTGNDVLVGDNPGVVSAADEGGDYLDGGAGDDNLQGNGGDDILIGGAGNDTLSGGAGKDIYVFNKGDGTETVFDTDANSNSPDASVLVLGDGVSRSDIKFRPGSLAVDLGPSDPANPNSPHDVIHFEGFDQLNPTATTPLGEIRFADGTSMSYADILAQGFDIDGTEGNDNGQAGEPPMLVGTGVVDRIRGFGGNDILAGLTGDDSLDGGAGNDELQGGNGDDVLDGGTEDDVLFGDAGDDNLTGGAGSDQLAGGGGADILDGGDGDDLLFGDGDDVAAADQAADLISGGLGNDNIRGYGGDDQLFGDDGSDTIFGEAGADYIEGGSGDDFLFGDSDTTAVADQGSDTLLGGNGNDQLVGNGGNDSLDGGAGNDVLFGDAGDDVLAGGDGDDQLQGHDGADTLAGGAGNDTLFGDAGDDVYVFNLGDGKDLIFDDATISADVLRFGPGIAVDDLTFARSGSDLVVMHANGTDEVTIASWYFNSGYQLARFEFADGTQLSGSDAGNRGLLVLRGTDANDTIFGSSLNETLYGLGGNDTLVGNDGADTFVGGTGNDTLVGGAGADVFRFALGDGQDHIQETGLVDDTLIFGPSIASGDISYRRVGNNLVFSHVNGTDKVTVDGWYTSGNVSFQLQSVKFESDGTVINNSALTTGGMVINDFYTFNIGDGAKLIEDWGGTDTLTFGAGIAKANIIPSRIAQDLVLTQTATDKVTIKDWFNDVTKQIEVVNFAGTGESFSHAELTDPFLTFTGTAGADVFFGGNAYGETILGLAGNDELHGGGGDDKITGGLGNDLLFGDAGNDRFFFMAGDGQDTVNDSDGVGVVEFGPNLVDKVNISFVSSGRLVSFTGSTDSVLIKDPTAGFSHVVIKFEVNGTANADTITGSSFGDVIQGLGGNDVIHGGDGADEIYGGPGNDTLEGGADSLSGQLDALYGGDGDDILDAGLLTDTGDPGGFYTGGPGNDTLNGNSGTDTYFFNLGDGQDLIDDEPFVSGITFFFSPEDQIVFGPGITADTLSGTRSGSDLIVIVSPTDRITIKNQLFDPAYQIDEFVFSDGGTLNTAGINALQFVQRGTSGNDTLTGADGSNDSLFGSGGNDTLTGLSGDDLLDGGTGNDVLNGGAGNDRYIFNAGYGQDQITDSGGTDTVQFGPGLTASNITLGRNVNSLLLSVNGTTDSVTITNYLSEPASRVENFTFTDGSQLPSETAILDQLVNIRGTAGDDALTGTSGFDAMFGFEGNDTLTALGDNDSVFGGPGNDTLVGGIGNDVLQGEDGDDTYQYAVGDGQDTVFDTSGFDSVVFGSGISTTAVTTTRNVSDLFLNVNVTGNPGKVTVQNYFNGQETEQIRFADGTIWDVATVRAKVLAASETSGNDVIYGYETNDTINALAGSDTVFGGAGNDAIDGGAGSDTLYGEDGDDVINAGSGDSNKASVVNNLYGGNGNDVLIASGKPDQLFGGPGNDIYHGGAGANWLEDSGGNNVMDGLSGNDQLWGGDQNDLVIGNTGNDSFDGDRDANGVRGRDIVLFNKADGTDTVTRLGTGSTLSIGGGTLYSNLSLSVSGNSLTLKVGTSKITFTDWYSGNKAVSTLQDVIEGTRDYSATSTNPINNKKIQEFDFLGLVSAFDVARAAGKTFNVANNLPIYRLSGSDTAAIGGAITYTYAKSSSISTLTDAQMQAFLAAPEFGVSAQSISTTTAATALATDTSVTTTAAAASFSAQTSTLLTTDVSAAGADAVQVSNPAETQTDTAGASQDSDGLPERPDNRVAQHELPTMASPIAPLRSLTQTMVAAPRSGVAPQLSTAAGSVSTTPPSNGTATHAAASESIPGEVPSALPTKGGSTESSDAANASNASAIAGKHPDGDRLSEPMDALIANWFAQQPPYQDLSQLDDIARGDGAVNGSPSGESVAAAWQRSQHWVNRLLEFRNGADDDGADGAGPGNLPILGAGNPFAELPQAAVGLRQVAGHDLKPFSGLREGVSVLTQS